MADVQYHNDLRKIKAGDILVVYYNQSSTISKNLFVDNFVKQTTDLIIPQDGSWPRIQPSKTVIVNTNELKVSVFTPTLFTPEKTEYDLEAPLESFDDLKESIQRVLIPIDGVCTVIVDGISSEDGYLPKTQEWIDMVSGVYGDLSSLSLVIVYDVDKGKDFGFNMAVDVITEVNKSLREEFHFRAKFVSLFGSTSGY